MKNLGVVEKLIIFFVPCWTKLSKLLEAPFKLVNKSLNEFLFYGELSG